MLGPPRSVSRSLVLDHNHPKRKLPGPLVLDHHCWMQADPHHDMKTTHLFYEYLAKWIFYSLFFFSL